MIHISINAISGKLIPFTGKRWYPKTDDPRTIFHGDSTPERSRFERGVVEFPWITWLQKSIRIVILSHVHNSTDIYIYSIQYAVYAYIAYIPIYVYRLYRYRDLYCTVYMTDRFAALSWFCRLSWGISFLVLASLGFSDPASLGGGGPGVVNQQGGPRLRSIFIYIHIGYSTSSPELLF